MKKVDASNQENRSSSTLMTKIKIIFLNGLSLLLFLVILGLTSIPTIFYYTAKDPEPTTNDSLRFKENIIKNPFLNTSCNKPLILSNDHQCVPQCGWKPWNEKQNWEIKGTTFSACILAVLSFIVVLLTWFKISQLWKFPNFIIVIMLGESTIIVMLVSVGMLLGDDVLCSSKFLPVAFKAPTAFCKFQGAAIHYLSGSISLWFVVYNIVIAKGLLSGKINVNQSQRRPLIISSLISWLLPLIPIIVVFKSKEGYSLFFSVYCFPGSSQLMYYTAILPVNILFAIGVTFLYTIIWKLSKERNISVTDSAEQERCRKTKMDVVVVRLTLLMICYAVTIYLTYGTIAYILNKTPVYETATKLYFYCLMFKPNCNSDYKKYKFHIPLLLNFVAAAIFPLSTVLFLVANEKARRLWKTSLYRLQLLLSKPEKTMNTSVTHLVNEDERNRELMCGT